MSATDVTVEQATSAQHSMLEACLSDHVAGSNYYTAGWTSVLASQKGTVTIQ